MKRLFLLSFAIIIAVVVKAQTTYTWVGANNGSWLVNTNWSPNTGTPVAGDNVIFTNAGTMTVANTPAIALNNLTKSGAGALTMTATSAGTILTINGTATVSAGSIAAGTNLALSFAAGSVYNHNMNSGTVPTATWNAASTCQITATTAGPTAGLNQTFGNFTLSTNAGVTTTSTGNTTINGTLTLTQGNLGIGAFTLTINGDLAVTSGFLSGTTSSILSIGGSGPLLTPFPFVSGAQNLNRLILNRPTGGTFIMGSNLTVNNTSATTCLNLTDGEMYINDYTLTLLGGITYGTGSLTGSSLSNLTFSGSTGVTTTLNTVINGVNNLLFTKSGTSTFTLNGNTIVAGNLQLNSGNTVAFGGSVLSVGGNVTHNGTMTSTSGGHVYLNGGTAQHVLSGTGTYPRLSLGDPLGAITTSSFSITGLFEQIDGTFTIGAGQTLTLGAGSSLWNSGNGSFGGTPTSNLTIQGTGNLGHTLIFSPSAPNLLNLSITRATSGFVELADMTINGTLTINATGLNVSIGNGSTVTFNNGTTPITITNGTFNGGSGRGIAFTGTGSCTLPLVTGGLQYLTVNRTGGATVTLGTSLAVDDLTLTAGALAIGANTLTINNDITAGGTGTISGITTSNLIINGANALSNSLNFTTGSQNLRQLTINRIAGGSVSLGTSLTLNLNTAAALTLTDGDFYIGNGNTLTFSTGQLTLGSGTLNGGTTSSLAFSGATAVTGFNMGNITGATLQNLSLTKTTASSFNFPNNFTLTGNLTVNASNTIALTTNNLTVGGNITHNGTMTATTGEILLSGGTAVHTLTGSSTYVNLELDDAFGASMAAGSSFTVSGNFVLTNGTYSVNTNTLTLNGPAIGGTAPDLNTTTTSILSFGGSSTGLFIPASVTNLASLTLNNANGLTLNNNLTLNATGLNLTISAGILYLGNNDLTLLSTATTSTGVISITASATRMIVADATSGSGGQVIRRFPSGVACSFTYPIGDITGTAEYSPVALTSFTATGGTKNIGVNVVDDIHPQLNSNATQSNYITRYWQFTESGPATSYTYVATSSMLTWVAADVVGGTLTTANSQINLHNSGAWTQLNSTVSGASASTTVTNNNTSSPFNNSTVTMRMNPGQTYTWVATSGSGDWAVPSNWSPARNTPAANDILQFINGGTPTATNVTAETIADLIIHNSTTVTLQAPAARILTINGPTASTNLFVGGGSTLQVGGGAGALTITIAGVTGQIADIDGALTLNTNGVFSSGIATTTVTVDGTLTVSGGTYTTTSTATTINGTATVSSGTMSGSGTHVVNGSFTYSGGTFTSSGFTFGAGSNYTHSINTTALPTATWNATSTANITSPTTGPTSGLGQTFGNLTINTGNFTTTLNGACTVAGTLTLTNGILAVAGQTLTLNGPAIAGTATNLNTTTASILSFGGSSPGVFIPSSVTNLASLTINNTNPQGVTLNSSITLNSTGVNLTLTNGLLFLDNYDLTLLSTATTSAGVISVSTPSATKMVVADATGGNTGQLIRRFPSGVACTLTYPIGDVTGTADYSPVSLTSFTATGGTKNIGVNVTNGTHPEMNSNATQTNYVSRYWSFTESGPATSYTYAATSSMFTWVGTDVTGTITTANDQINFYDAGTTSWSQLNSTISGTTASTTATNSNISGELGGNDFTIRLNGPQTYTWVATSGSGDWNTPGNWSPVRNTPSATDILQFSNGGTPTAINVPTQTIGRLLVSGGTTATLQTGAATTLSINGATATNNLSVANGATLQLGGGAALLTLNYNTTNGQLAAIDGTLTLNANGTFTTAVSGTAVTVGATGTVNVSGGTYTSSSGTTTLVNGALNHNSGTLTATGAITIGATGNYYYNINGGTVPTLTWSAGSTCTIGSSTTAPTAGVNQTFSNFTVAAGSGVTVAATGGITINGALTVTSGTFSLGVNTLTLNGIITPGTGPIISTSGSLTVAGTGGDLLLPPINGLVNLTLSRSVAATTTLDGNVAITGTFTNNNLNTLDIDGNNFSVGGSFTNNSGAVVTANAAGSTITLNGTSVPNFAPASSGTLTGGTIYNLTINKSSVGVNMTGNVTVSNQLTLTAGTFTISGAALTLTGLPIAGTPTLLAASASNTSGIVIGGTAAGHFLPSSLSANFFGFLTVNNPNGVTLNSNINLNASPGLTLTNGNVILNGFNLTMNSGTAGAVSGGSATSYVEVDGTNNGAQFIRTVTSTGSYFFPIGTATEYGAATLNFTTNGVSRAIGARFIPSTHPSINSPTAADSYIDRYWRFTTSNNTNLYTYQASFTYPGATVTGTESTLKVSRFNGSVWNEDGGATVNTGTDVLTSSTGLTQTNWDLNTVDFTGRVMPMAYISSTVVQQTGTLAPSDVNEQIIQIQVVTSGSGTPLNLNSLTFNTNGSTNAADIASAKIYYTGSSATFSTATLYGSAVTNPSGSHTVSGSQTLVSGTNYFWVAYDISASPTIGNVVDAECTNINLSSNNYTPSVTAPSGNRPIMLTYCTPNMSFGALTLQTFPFYITSVSLGTLNATGMSNVSPNSAPYYQEMPQTGVVTAGQTYTLSISRFTTGYTVHGIVYADWYGNGNFTQTGETLMTGSYGSSTTKTASITVPADAVPGIARLRVINLYSPTAIGPCTVNSTGGFGAQGETKDFNITVLPGLPTAYPITGSNGCTTATLGVSDSETGVDYQLQLDGSDIGAPVAGTGNAISFGAQTAPGTYTVVGTNNVGSTNMTGSVVIYGNPATPAGLADQERCLDGNVTFTANNPGAGYEIQWSTDGVNHNGGVSLTYTIAVATGSPVTMYARTRNTTGNCFSAWVPVMGTAWPAAVPNASALDVDVCFGDAINLTADAMVSYNWTGPNSFTSTAQNPVIASAILANSGTYNVTVTDVHGCSGSGSVAINVATCGTVIWTGATDHNWNDGTNWSGGFVPSVLNDVIIPDVANDPILTTGPDGAVRGLTIYSGATIIVNTGKKIAVKTNWNGAYNDISGAGLIEFNGTTAQTITGGGVFNNITVNNSHASGLTVAAGGLNQVKVRLGLNLQKGPVTSNSNLYFTSTATQTAYINNFGTLYTGTINGTVTMERYNAGPTGFRYLSMPTNNTPITQIDEVGLIGPDMAQLIPTAACSPTNLASNSPYGNVMEWHENGPFTLVPGCRQLGWYVRSAGTLENFRGYLVKMHQNTAVVVSGTPNLTAQTYAQPLNNTNSTGDGWHLMGNPYPSPVQWTGVSGFGDMNLFSTVGIYTGTYAAFAPVQNKIIATMQGFFVRRLSAGGMPFSLPNASRRAVSNITYQSSNDWFDHLLEIDIVGNGFGDHSTLYFNSGATADYEAYFDARKMDGREDQPAIYTHLPNGTEQLGVNGLGSLDQTYAVPLVMKPGQNGEFTLNFSELATFPASAMIYLEDLQTGTLTDLRVSPSYTFTSDINDNPERFIIRFEPPVAATVADATCETAGSIEVTQAGNTVWSSYQLRDNNNNIHAQGSNFSGSITFANLAAQEYILKLTHPSGYTAEEFFTVNGTSTVSADMNVSDNSVAVNEAVTFTANVANASELVWDFGDGEQAIGSTVSHSYVIPGNYAVVLTASNDVCENVASDVVNVSAATGLNNTTAETLVINGYGAQVSVEFNNWGANKADIFVFNTLGQRVESFTGVSTITGRQLVTIADVKPGYYFIQVVSNGKVHGKKVYLGAN